MSRRVGRLLLVLGPALVVCGPVLRAYLAAGTVEPAGEDVLLISMLAHGIAVLLALAALAVAGRLAWRSGEILVVAARALLWLDLTAAWALTCAAAATAIAHRLSLGEALWGVSLAIAVLSLLSAALLALMIHHAEGGAGRPKPWTLFA